MAALKDKVKFALDEGRILVLGAQVFIGFDYRGMLQKGFDNLPSRTQHLRLVTLGLMLCSFSLLVYPAAYHHIAAEGKPTGNFLRSVTVAITLALLPFALGMTFDFYIVMYRVSGAEMLSIGISAVLLIFTFGLWFGYTLYRRGRRK